MSDVIALDGFEGMLRGVLRERVGVEAPRGLEQRLMARLMQAEESVVVAMPRRFAFAEQVGAPRGSRSVWFAMGAHAAVLLLLVALASVREGVVVPVKKTLTMVELSAPPLPMPQRLELARGGGGHHDAAPVSAGHLPKIVTEQLVAPKLPMTASVVVPPDLKMADNTMPNMGSPASTLKGLSMGSGMGTGVGVGHGAGIGPGSGGSTGGGIYHVGGGVSAPVLLRSVDPVYSEEARKAKFSGNVEVYLVIDQKGDPIDVKVARGVGMGLDQKAVAAVRQYKFKPAMKDGKPVKVDMYVDVNYQIF